MKIQKIALLSILFLLIISNTFPQTAKMKFEYLTADKGLASNRVRDILRDSKGYLWIVCEGGLSRYDGYTTRTFSNDPEDSTSLSDNVPFCIFEDSQKTLWVGTSNGLNVFNPDYETFQRFYSNPDAPNSLSANFIFDITEDKAGNVWIATNNGLNLWNRQNNDFKRFFIKTEEKHLTSNSINSVFIDNKNKIFVSGASKYIFQFNPQNGIFTKINNEPDTLPGSVNKFITVDNANILWIATNFSGLYHFDLTTKKLFKYSTNGDGTGTNLASLEGVLLLNNNYLYIPVNHGGINIMNLKTRKFDYLVFDENAENGLNNSGIWKLYQDTEKILWVGTSAGGVNYFNPKMERFNTFRHSNKDANSLIYNTIYTLFEDSYGLIWIGTDGGGLSVYDPQKKTFTNYKHEPDNSSSLSGNAVLAFTEDKDHDIWIGTWDCGLNRFDRKTGKFITYMHDPKDTTSISANQIMALKTDVNGLIWISAYNNGIDVFDKNKGVIKRYTNNSADNHSLSNKFIGRIIIQPDGVLGFVTGNGYCTYDIVNENFKRIAAFDGYSLHDLYIDSKGNYWGTTLDKGVIVLTNDGKTLKKKKKIV